MGSHSERKGTLQSASQDGADPTHEARLAPHRPRVVIATRIYSPEVAAASFRLRALAHQLANAGASVRILTTRAPKANAIEPAVEGVSISRFPVLRDRDGNIRGYVQYLSFDVPLFFRLLFSRADVMVAEPPPTTGAVSAMVSRFRRLPFVYYAADVWTDAVASTNAPRIVVTLMRKLEKSVVHRAHTVLAVSDGVAQRIQEFGATRVRTVGNGVDTTIFTPEGSRGDEADLGEKATPMFVYAGTMSEWQGSEVFLEAFALLSDALLAQLHIFGQGSQLNSMRARAAEIAPDRIHFHGVVSAAETAQWLRRATASLVSIKPDQGYDFAKPTKLYAAAACGTPVVFAGDGAAKRLVTSADLGLAVPHSPEAVAEAMLQLAREQAEGQTAAMRATRATWARDHASLVAVGKSGADAILAIASEKMKDGSE